MRPSIILALSLIVIALCGLTGCGRFAPGFIIGENGEMIANNDENQRAQAVKTIRTQLDAQLGGHWRTEAAITELPVYQPDDRSRDSDWRWDKATVTVTLVGDGTAPLPFKAEELRNVVHEYLSPKVDHAKRNLVVTLTPVTDAARFTALGSAPATSAGTPLVANPAPAASPASERRYAIQPGDTFADLSTAFYGSPEHWRRIANANPGLADAPLKSGTVIIIPPKP